MSIHSGKHQQPESWLDSENLLRDLRNILWARKWLILGTALLTFALTAIGTWLTKPIYSSSASILVKKERFDAPVTPEQIIAGHPDTRMAEEDVNSEVEILNSPSLQAEVVKKLQLEKNFEAKKSNSVFAAFDKDPADEKLSAASLAAMKLQENLTVEPGKKSNLIKITYKDNNREQAAKVVNTLCDLYQERHIKLRENVGATDFFVEQADAMRAKLYEKEAELRRISPLPNPQLLNQQIETQMRQLNEFEVALQSTQTSIIEGEARIKSLAQQLVSEPERLKSEERISHRTAPDAIRAQLFTLELRRSELLGKYKPEHRLIRDLEKDIEKARRMIEAVEKAPAESTTTSALNPLRQRLNDTLTTERSTLASLRQKEKSLIETVGQSKAKVRELGVQGYEQRRLDRERELADQSYQLYSKKGEESRVSTALDKEGIINVRVAEPASIPFKATSPNVPLNLILGLIGGVILGLVTAFTFEYFQPTARANKPLATINKISRLVTRVGS